jgi:hypothetical protein
MCCSSSNCSWYRSPKAWKSSAGAAERSCIYGGCIHDEFRGNLTIDNQDATQNSMLSHQVLVGRDLSLIALALISTACCTARKSETSAATPARETNAARRSFCIIAKSRQLGSLFARKRLIA